MNIEVVEKNGLKRELNIEVPADIVDREYGKIYAQYGKTAKVKGFRPGKVPVKIIRNRFKQEATVDVIDNLIKKYFSEAMQEKKLEPVGKPIISKVDVDEGKPLTFTVGIEIMPEVKTIEYDNLVIKEKTIEVSDDEVDEIIKQISKGNAEIRSVDRPARENDILICDLEATEGDIDAVQNPLQNYEIDLDYEYTFPEFRDGLTGVKRDESREIKIDYPPDYSDKNFAGKSITYRVTVREIKERVPPLLNDDFARQTGYGETLLELRLAVRKQIEGEKRTNAIRSAKSALIAQLVERNRMDVPEAMVESYLDGVVENFKKDPMEIDEKTIREKYRSVGMNAVRWYLLYRRLAQQEKIEVSPEDTENWIRRFAENYRIDVPQAKQVLAKSGKASEIKEGILEEKVVDFLMSKADRKEIVVENKKGDL